MMEVGWTNSTDKHVCLCCGQTLAGPGRVRTAKDMHYFLTVFEAMGFTRESLLTEHRAQLDYQCPGMAAWLQGQ